MQAVETAQMERIKSASAAIWARGLRDRQMETQTGATGLHLAFLELAAGAV